MVLRSSRRLFSQLCTAKSSRHFDAKARQSNCPLKAGEANYRKHSGGGYKPSLHIIKQIAPAMPDFALFVIVIYMQKEQI
jgi:hypothetical protein